MIRAAVITVSDSAHAGQREDLSGPAVVERLERLGWQVEVRMVVPDESAAIETALRDLAATGSIQAIFTTGGTGVALRDVTPEATRAVLDREIPGLPELMRAEGLKFTPRASLSRAVAGTRGSVLIVNFPGSPKGACESFDAIAGLLPHIVDLLAGNTAHPPQKKPPAR